MLLCGLQGGFENIASFLYSSVSVCFLCWFLLLEPLCFCECLSFAGRCCSLLSNCAGFALLLRCQGGRSNVASANYASVSVWKTSLFCYGFCFLKVCSMSCLHSFFSGSTRESPPYCFLVVCVFCVWGCRAVKLILLVASMLQLWYERLLIVLWC